MTIKQQLALPSQLGVAIRAARVNSGMTQAELAVRVGLSQKRISSLELHPGSMTIEQLLGISAAIGLEVMLQTKGTDAPLGDW